MPLKIAMIGAGSIGFTRRLMADLLTVPEFADTIFRTQVNGGRAGAADGAHTGGLA